MTKKAKSGAPQKRSNAAPHQGDSDVPPADKARMVLSPSVQAGFTVKDTAKGFGDLDLGSLIGELKSHMKAVNARQLDSGINQLVGQASTLDFIYHTLARRAMRAGSLEGLDALLKLALRAQAQSRTTWSAISEIQNPPVAGYVRQANIAHGAQQVNNGSSPNAGGNDARGKTNFAKQTIGG